MPDTDEDFEQRTRFEEGEPTLDADAPEGEAPPEEGGPAVGDEPGPDPEAAAEEEEGATRGGGVRLSRKGARFIARFEGYVAKPYNDAVGHCTIGYGHLLHLGNCRPADRDRRLDPEEAIDLLRRDARQAAQAVRALGADLDQPRFDALVSFTFNLGAGWTASSGLQRALARGDHAAVPGELSKWVYAGSPPRRLQGLVNRRRAEGRLYASGNY
jgi:GH24 family phage-related lysozyme (muramidase)